MYSSPTINYFLFATEFYIQSTGSIILCLVVFALFSHKRYIYIIKFEVPI